MRKPLKNTGTERLADIIDFEKDIAPYNLIQLVAGVGAGKNYWACKLANEGYRVLLITSRRATADAQAKHMGADKWFDFDSLIKNENVWGTVPGIQKKAICTNYQIELFIKKYYNPEDPKTHVWNYFDFIFLDEAHSLSSDATFADSPFYVERFLKYAHKQNKNCKIIVMTGTPEPIDWLFEKSPRAVHKLNYFNKCIHVEPEHVDFIPSSDVLNRLTFCYKNGRRAIYFINHTNKINALVEDLKKCGVPEEAIGIAYSQKEDDAKFPKNLVDTKYEIRESLKNTEKLPERIKIFITTSVHKEGVSIEDDDIFAVFSERHVHADLTQMIGRVRNGVKYFLVIYDADQYYTKEDALMEYVKGASAASVAAAATDFLYGSNLSKWPQIIEEIERKYPEVKYDLLTGHFYAYNGRIAGKQKVRRDENNFKEFIENWNYHFGRYDERGWESLQDWFPYSYVSCFLDDEDKDINVFKKLQRDVDNFLRDNGFLRRINHDEYKIILEALNTIIQGYPSRDLPKNLRKPSKTLTPLLKNFNYDVKHGMHGVYYEIIKIEAEET